MKKLLAYLLMVATCYGGDYQVNLSDLNNAEWVEVALGDYRILWSDIGGVTPPAGLSPVLSWKTGSATNATDDSGNDLHGTGTGLDYYAATNGMGDFWDGGLNDGDKMQADDISAAGLSNNAIISCMIRNDNENASLLNYYACLYKSGGSSSMRYGVGGTFGAATDDVYSFDLDANLQPHNSAGVWTSARDGKWYNLIIVHVATGGVFNAANPLNKVYINCELQATTGLNGKQDFTTNTVLRLFENETSQFELDGAIDYFQLFDDKEPTQDEINLIGYEALNANGQLSGWLLANTGAVARTVANVNCNNQFTDFKGNHMDSPDLPSLAGTPAIGWGSGNGVAEHGVIVANNATNIMFTAGASVSTMTNYAVINGVQYMNGTAQPFTNTFYETTATSNVFWRYDGGTFYNGLISQIHVGSYTESDYTSWHNWVNANIDWNP